MKNIVRVMALALAAALGTGVLAIANRSGSPNPAEDRAELLKSVSYGPAAFVREYSRLADMLPHVKTADGGAATDSVVVGSVTAVSGDAGYIELRPPGGLVPGTPSARVTTFDDPGAHWRTLKVVVEVEEVLAGSEATQLEFSWPILGNSRQGHDEEAVGRALQALGRIVVLSQAAPPGPGSLGIERALPDKPLGILSVAADGTLSFPLAAGDGGEHGSVDGDAYLAGLGTLDELRIEAAKPNRPFPYK